MPLFAPEIMDMLRCPRDKAETRSIARLEEDGAVLRCRQGHEYPVIDGVPDLRPRPSRVGAENYGDIHSEFEIADPAKVDLEALTAKYALEKGDVEGKDVLLAGAGVGTELLCLLRLRPRRLVAVDYSPNIRRLRQKYQGDPAAVFMQADILSLPFLDDSFDLVFNSGVLQHTRSPELAFREMYHCVKPGGAVSIGSMYMDNVRNRRITMMRLKHDLHHRPFAEVREFLWRRILRRSLLRRFRLHGLDRELTGLIIPNEGEDPAFALRQALDWYFPEYRHVFTEEEIQQWFVEVGCTDVRKTGRQHIGKKAAR